MAEWEKAFLEWEKGEHQRYLHDNIEATKVDAFRAGARWMARRASDHLAGASKIYVERDDDTHLLIAHLHTDMEVECLRDTGDWRTHTGDE
jgi:hypothetical protein